MAGKFRGEVGKLSKPKTSKASRRAKGKSSASLFKRSPKLPEALLKDRIAQLINPNNNNNNSNNTDAKHNDTAKGAAASALSSSSSPPPPAAASSSSSSSSPSSAPFSANKGGAKERVRLVGANKGSRAKGAGAAAAASTGGVKSATTVREKPIGRAKMEIVKSVKGKKATLQRRRAGGGGSDSSSSSSSSSSDGDGDNESEDDEDIREINSNAGSEEEEEDGSEGGAAVAETTLKQKNSNNKKAKTKHVEAITDPFAVPSKKHADKDKTDGDKKSSRKNKKASDENEEDDSSSGEESSDHENTTDNDGNEEIEEEEEEEEVEQFIPTTRVTTPVTVGAERSAQEAVAFRLLRQAVRDQSHNRLLPHQVRHDYEYRLRAVATAGVVQLFNSLAQARKAGEMAAAAASGADASKAANDPYHDDDYGSGSNAFSSDRVMTADKLQERREVASRDAFLKALRSGSASKSRFSEY